LTHDDLTAQATVFFLAGFETSSTVMSFACLEIAVNNDIQKKAQLEIDETLNNHDGKLTYDALKEMKYLDCIVQGNTEQFYVFIINLEAIVIYIETLRKYPPAGTQIRICTKNYVIPGTDVQIDKGTPITIPSYSLQMDPKYFPDPENFDPERFNEENALHKYQYLHMPFGEGPRKCIGIFFTNKLKYAYNLEKHLKILQEIDSHCCNLKWDLLRF